MKNIEIERETARIERIVDKHIPGLLDDLVDRLPDRVTDKEYLAGIYFIYKACLKGKKRAKLAADVFLANMLQKY